MKQDLSQKYGLKTLITEESGGIYLFENQETAENYVSMHSERLKEMGVDQVEAKYFQVNEPLSQLNQANLPNV